MDCGEEIWGEKRGGSKTAFACGPIDEEEGKKQTPLFLQRGEGRE